MPISPAAKLAQMQRYPSSHATHSLVVGYTPRMLERKGCGKASPVAWEIEDKRPQYFDLILHIPFKFNHSQCFIEFVLTQLRQREVRSVPPASGD